MKLLAILGIVVLLYYGTYTLYCSYHGILSIRTTKALKQATTSRWKASDQLLLRVVDPLAAHIEPIIRLPTEKEVILQQQLDRAGLQVSSKRYYARALVYAAISSVFPIYTYVMGMTSLTPFGIAIIPLVFFHMVTKHKDLLKRKQRRIESVMPGFVRAILYRLNSDNQNNVVKANLTTIFEDYLLVADPELQYDISLLVMDMKSLDKETGIRNFNQRMGLPYVGMLCDALIGLTRGERQEDALKAIARDMDVMLQEQIKMELASRPKKVMRACIPLTILAIGTLLYVVLMVFAESMAQF